MSTLTAEKSVDDLYVLPTHKVRPVGIAYFLIIHIVGLIGAPLYGYYVGFQAADWILFLVYAFLSNMAITVGYHRLYAHHSFKTKPWIHFCLLFFGASTFEQSALKWASQHRQHHKFTDTDLDPYDINKGFFYAHIGWIIFRKHKVNHANVPDLVKNRVLVHQHKWYGVWSVTSGIILPILIGASFGRPLEAFVLAVCLRLVVVMNSAFFINSFCHTFGSRPYDETISARDSWMGAFLANGEGYHNFHHRFPSDYRNGYRWYHWDPSKWFIRLFSYIGQTWDLRFTPTATISQAQANTR